MSFGAQICTGNAFFNDKTTGEDRIQKSIFMIIFKAKIEFWGNSNTNSAKISKNRVRTADKWGNLLKFQQRTHFSISASLAKTACEKIIITNFFRSIFVRIPLFPIQTNPKVEKSMSDFSKNVFGTSNLSWKRVFRCLNHWRRPN